MKTKLLLSGILCMSIATLSSQNSSYNQNTIPLIPGNFNSGFGNQVLQMNMSGNENCAFGHESLFQNTSGNSNTANGLRSLFNNSTGSFNSAFGWQADVGSNNLTNATAIGANAVVTTNNAIQLGDANVTQVFAGTSTNATIISGGIQITGGTPASGKVLTSNASGVGTWQNLSASGIGGWATLGNAGTVDGTNFIGTTDNVPFNIRVNSLRAGRIDNTYSNMFYGITAGPAVATTYQNCAFGKNSLTNMTTGGANTAFGSHSLFNLTTGMHNSAFGLDALLYTNGNRNACVGFESFQSVFVGDDNSALGAYTNVSGGSVKYNSTALGSYAVVNTSNKVRIGDANVTVIEGQVAFTNPSDGRFKYNINEEDVKGLEFINLLRPVVYNFDTKKFTEFLTQNMPEELRQNYLNKNYANSTNIRHSGFIAQEVEKAANQSGYNFDGIHKPENDGDNYSLSYSQFIVPLVKAVQEQQQMIEEQKQTNQKLQAQIDQLRKSNEELLNKSENVTGINNMQNTINKGYGLEQNIPNPFSHETIIKYSLPQSTQSAYLGVYDMNGKQVASFPINERGSSSLIITSEKLTAGMYFYSIIADGKILDTKRMVVSEK